MAAYENNFNLIRFIAASQVFYVHTSGWLKAPQLQVIPLIGKFLTYVVYALPGVPIFFVISGFLVTQSFLKGSGGLAGYFERRALRIFPALWTHYIVIFIMLAIAGVWSADQLLTVGMWQWIAGAFFIGSDWWGNIVSNVRPFEWNETYGRFPSGVLWTINVELGFYLLVPLVFASFWRRWRVRWLVMLVFAVASILFAMKVTQMENAGVRGNIMGFMRNQPAAYFWVFLIGAAVAVYWEKIRGLFERRFLYWALAYAGATLIDKTFFGVGGIKVTNLEILTIPRMVILAGAVIAFAYSLPAIGKPFRNFDLSYAMYLYHMPVIWTALAFGLTGTSLAWLVVIPIVLGISAASWFLIEKPVMLARSRAPRALRSAH